MKGTCLRCGNYYARLDRHIRTRQICRPIYLNINREIMMDDYEKMHNEFLRLKNLVETGHKCTVCGKCLKHKSNMARHIKTHGQDSAHCTNYITNNFVNNTTHIDNVTNITNVVNHYNIVLNNFGEEKDLDYEALKDLLESHEDKTDVLSEYAEKLFIDIEENRNVYLPSKKDKFMHVYKNNKWTHQEKRIIKQLILKKLMSNIGAFAEIYYENAKGKSEGLNIIKMEEHDHCTLMISVLKELKYCDDIRNIEENKIEGKLLDNRSILSEIYKASLS